MTIQHKEIESEERHEIKGFEEAPVNTFHTKNSQGQVEWVDLDSIGGNPVSHATRHLPETGEDKLPTVEPQTIGEVNSVGTSDDFVRGDHVHAHGIQNNETLHLVALQTKHGFMSKEDKVKIDGIESGATADQTAIEIKSLYESNLDTNEFNDTEKSKLAAIETEATRDQSASEIKISYESNLNTNAFEDLEKSKLSGISAGAEVNQNDTQIKNQYEANANTNAYTDAEKSKLSGLESSKFLGEYVSLSALQTANPSPVIGSYANVDTGIGQDVVRYIWDTNDSNYVLQLGQNTSLTDAQIKQQYENNADTNAYTDAEKTKLGTVETSAEVNQTDAEIKVQYEANSNTNAFEDLEKTKLGGIEAGAEVNQTDAEIKVQYEANANTNEKYLLSRLDVGWLQYNNTSNQTTTAASPAYTVCNLNNDIGSFPNGLFTKLGTTDFRTDFTGYVEISIAATGQNTVNNDRTWFIAIEKNGTLIPYSKSKAAGKANVGRETGAARTFMLDCAPSDIFKLVFTNNQAAQSTTIRAEETTFFIKSLRRT